VLLLCGTRKGLFLLHGDDDRSAWELEGPLLTGWSVYHAIRDRRDSSLQVAANNFVYGGTFQRSTDDGKNWQRAEGLGLPEDSELKLEETWHVEPGREDGEMAQRDPRHPLPPACQGGSVPEALGAR
jgi:predicted Rdx family selenoprotein